MTDVIANRTSRQRFNPRETTGFGAPANVNSEVAASEGSPYAGAQYISALVTIVLAAVAVMAALVMFIVF